MPKEISTISEFIPAFALEQPVALEIRMTCFQETASRNELAFQTGCLTSAPRGKGQAFCNPVARSCFQQFVVRTASFLQRFPTLLILLPSKSDKLLAS